MTKKNRHTSLGVRRKAMKDAGAPHLEPAGLCRVRVFEPPPPRGLRGQVMCRLFCLFFIKRRDADWTNSTQVGVETVS